MGNIKAKTHLEKLGFSEPDKKKPTHDTIQTWVYQNIETVIKETVMLENEHQYKIVNNKWEHEVVYSKGNYKMVVGFIDILAEIKGVFHFDPDMRIQNYDKKPVFIEVKTEIPSLGELIRQMRAYQAYQDNYLTSYLIVSPDDRHEKILKEQGFYFYKYKDPSLLF